MDIYFGFGFNKQKNINIDTKFTNYKYKLNKNTLGLRNLNYNKYNFYFNMYYLIAIILFMEFIISYYDYLITTNIDYNVIYSLYLILSTSLTFLFILIKINKLKLRWYKFNLFILIKINNLKLRWYKFRRK